MFDESDEEKKSSGGINIAAAISVKKSTEEPSEDADKESLYSSSKWTSLLSDMCMCVCLSVSEHLDHSSMISHCVLMHKQSGKHTHAHTHAHTHTHTHVHTHTHMHRLTYNGDSLHTVGQCTIFLLYFMSLTSV